MTEIKIDLKEEPIRKVGPISKSLTLWSVVILLLILTITVMTLLIVPSPDTDNESFLIFLLRNMNLIH